MESCWFAISASASWRLLGARPSGRFSLSRPTNFNILSKTGSERHRSAVNGALLYRQPRDAPVRDLVPKSSSLRIQTEFNIRSVGPNRPRHRQFFEWLTKLSDPARQGGA